jgi:hypothetical protein
MINELESFDDPFIDRLQRIEAERMLKAPDFKDIDAFLFMYNRVVKLENIIDKLNEVITLLNEGKI